MDTEAGGQVAGDKGAKQEARQEEGTRVRQPDRSTARGKWRHAGGEGASQWQDRASIARALAVEGAHWAGRGAGVEHRRQEEQSRNRAYHMLDGRMVGRGEHNPTG